MDAPLSKRILQTLSLILALSAAPGPAAAQGAGSTIDLVHFWVSESEAAALDVYRRAWAASGRRWVDLPAASKVDAQRIVSDRIANGYAPLVMQWNANEGAQELPEMGVVIDLEDVALANDWRNVLPKVILDRISYKQKIYFAPVSVHSENWLWVSARHFSDKGLGIPRDWDEILAAAEQIKKSGHLPLALGGGDWEIILIFNNILNSKLGSEGMRRALSGDPAMLRDPRMVEALQTLRQLSTYVEPLSERSAKTWADASAAVGRGEAGMQFMGDWAKGELLSKGFRLEKDFDCALAPDTDIAYFMVIDAFAFPVTSQDDAKEAQFAFAQMLLEPQHQTEFSRIKGSLPARIDVPPHEFDKCSRMAWDMMRRGSEIDTKTVAMPSHISDAYISAVAEYFNNADVTLDHVQNRLVEILEPR